MPRNGASGAQLSALQAGSLQPRFFVSIQFASGSVYLWTGIGSVSWNGQTWTGLGALLNLVPIETAPTVEARGVTIMLSGFDATLMPDLQQQFQLGLPVSIYYTDWNNGTPLTPPIAAWSGRTDQPIFDVAGGKATVSLACENRLIDMNVRCERRHTNEDQQMQYPGDLAFQFVYAIQDITLFIGGQANVTSFL